MTGHELYDELLRELEYRHGKGKNTRRFVVRVCRLAYKIYVYGEFDANLIRYCGKAVEQLMSSINRAAYDVSDFKNVRIYESFSAIRHRVIKAILVQEVDNIHEFIDDVLYGLIHEVLVNAEIKNDR